MLNPSRMVSPAPRKPIPRGTARRAGTYIAVLSGQGIGVAVLVVLAAFLRPSLGAIDPATAIGLVAAGLLGLLGYLTFYRALEYGGAVGLTSAISATYGGITTLLAVFVLGELFARHAADDQVEFRYRTSVHVGIL